MEYVYLLHTAASLDDPLLRMQVIGSYFLARNFVKIKKCVTFAKHDKQLLFFINGLKATVRELCLITYAIFFPLVSFVLMTSITDSKDKTTLHKTIKTVLQKFNVVFRNLSVNGNTIGFHPQAQKLELHTK